MISLVVILALVAIPIAVLYNGVWQPTEDISCSSKSASFFDIDENSFEGECFFRNSYEEAKEQFLHLAQECKAEMINLPVIGEYSTDVAILRGSTEKYLIHMSGTHGVEGFAGSAIQAAALYSLCSPSRPKYGSRGDEPTIVFVHAVNPWGFGNNRRVNEENIDLNRNFLTEQEFKDFQQRDPDFAGYVGLFDLFNPLGAPFQSTLVNHIASAVSAVKGLIVGGYTNVKTALVAGNYHFPKGLSYGGAGLSTSAKNIHDLILNHPSIGVTTEARKFIMIDVHTGLGPSGVDTFLPHIADNNSEEIISKFFPTDFDKQGDNGHGAVTGGIKPWLSEDAKAVDSGYELTAGMTSDFFGLRVRSDLDSWHKLNIVQEFGTYPGILVAKGFVDENRAFHYGSDDQKKYYGEILRSLFFVQTKNWTRSVARRGMKVILQACDFLNAEVPITSEE